MKSIRVLLSASLLVPLLLVFPPGAKAANPNFPNVTGNIRLDAPDDPDFDRAEDDDASGDFVSGTSVFSEQWELLGFAPDGSSMTAFYLDPLDPNFGQPQISGVRADRGWERQIGRPDVVVAIVDTGIRWNKESLRRRVWLNRGELPVPQFDLMPCPGYSVNLIDPYDVNHDQTFDVEDYACDSRVDPNSSSRGVANKVDGLDVINAFSNGDDADSNGFRDDIAGWDFFDDDNDPDDTSSYAAAGDHGSGRAEDALEETNDDSGDAGVCPHCRLAPMRVWDSFVPDMNHFSLGVAYAADNGFRVVEGAIGGLQNAKFARETHQYAYEKGIAITEVSSDANTANHNYPTNYNNVIYVAGLVADVHGANGNEFFPPIPFVPSQPPIGTWFRNSGLTQYGGHHMISMMGDTGSHCTGQAAGAVGLLHSEGRDDFPGGLTSNEVKQVLTLTAEDVLPGNTGGIGAPDPMQLGWDQHSGYGRANLDAALARIESGVIPPEGTLESPPWFQVLDPDPNGDGVLDASFPITATISNARNGGVASWTLQVGPGIEPLEAQFVTIASGVVAAPLGHGPGGTRPGALLATIPATAIAAAGFTPGKNFSLPPVTAGPPQHGQANVPSNEFMFTLRLRVTDPTHPGNFGEDRKSLFLHHDPTLHAGWPKFTNVGGEASPKMADIDGDNRLDLVVADSAGEISVWRHDGVRLPSFNAGQAVQAQILTNAQAHLAAPIFQSIAAPRGAFTTPAVGDLDRDGSPEIVAASDDKVYAFNSDGSLRAGFPVQLNRTFSSPAVRNTTNHVKTGFFSAPALGDLDHDGKLEIVIGAMDQRVYAWNDDGTPVPGWPVYCKDPSNPVGQHPGAEITAPPTLADLDGDGWLDVVISTAEIYDGSFNAQQEFTALFAFLSDPSRLTGFPGELAGTLLDAAFANAGSGTRIYAIRHNGTAYDGNPADDGGFVVDADAFLPGWPAKINALLPDIIPFLGPAMGAASAELDGNPRTREVVAVATSSDAQILRSDGTKLRDMDPAGFGAGSDVVDRSVMVNVFEYPVIADLEKDGDLDIIKGGFTLNGAVNLLLAGQNLPFNHIVQAWDATSGAPLSAFPRATDDFQWYNEPVVADVGSLAPGVADGVNEIVVGTGLYLLHAYNPLGTEPTGWPKVTGGWIWATPVLGDLDADGKLEVVAATREGNLFVWDTDGPACGNNEWSSYQHDEWNTSNYGQDTRPPDRIVSLAGVGLIGHQASLTWTAPGDDGPCGTASSYELRWSASPITPANFGAAKKVNLPVPGAPGAAQAAAFTAQAGAVHVGLRALDEAGNPGRLQTITLAVP